MVFVVLRESLREFLVKLYGIFFVRSVENYMVF